MDREGGLTAADDTWIADFITVEISPDGNRAAVTVGWGDFMSDASLPTEIWLTELDEGSARRLTSYQGQNHRPVWSPDGTSLAFISDRGGRRAAYSVPVDGIVEPQLLLEHPDEIDEVLWSPDGDWLIYRTGTTDNARDIYARRLRPDTATIVVSAQPGIDERAPALSLVQNFLAQVKEALGD